MKDKVKEIVDNLSQLKSEERSEVMNQVQHYFEIVGNADKMRNKPTIGESFLKILLDCECKYVSYKTQVPIETVDDKYFIADFLLGNKLIVEVDGGYHSTEEQKQKDERRTQILEEAGYEVIRLTDEQIKAYMHLKCLLVNLQDYFNNSGEEITFKDWMKNECDSFLNGKEKEDLDYVDRAYFDNVINE